MSFAAFSYVLKRAKLKLFFEVVHVLCTSKMFIMLLVIEIFLDQYSLSFITRKDVHSMDCFLIGYVFGVGVNIFLGLMADEEHKITMLKWAKETDEKNDWHAPES